MNKVLFLFLLFSGIAFSQSKLELTYKVTSSGKQTGFIKHVNEEIKPFILDMEKSLDDLTFTLQIKGKESLWFLNDRDTYPTSHMGKAFAGNTTYYFDSNQEEYLTQEEF